MAKALAGKEFVGAIIEGTTRLASRLNEVDVELARELLDATYYDYPRPAWNTGQLRSSGAVYIGGKLIATTPETSPNPLGWYETRGGKMGQAEANVGAFEGVGELKIGKIRRATDIESMVTSLKGAITVIYQSPVAALMHEWPHGFTDGDSGRGYISEKLLKFDRQFTEVFRRVFSGVPVGRGTTRLR